MSRKSRKGYYVNGDFVPAGSALDRQLKAELAGTGALSRTGQKQESEQLQALGEELLSLHDDAFTRLQLPPKLADAIHEARRISARGGRRRQLQFIGKLMRQQEPATVAAIRAALQRQHGQSARDTAALHRAESWRDRLISDDGALSEWLREHPGTDAQQLRALIRQARRDATPPPSGEAQRQGRAFRAIFRLVREQLAAPDAPQQGVSPSPAGPT